MGVASLIWFWIPCVGGGPNEGMEAGVGLWDGVLLHIGLKHCTCSVRTQKEETLWIERRLAKSWFYFEKKWHGRACWQVEAWSEQKRQVAQ